MKGESGPWHPPSEVLEKRNGIWMPHSVSAVSYPDEGNALCFQVEAESFWFAHRNDCIGAVMKSFPPSGMVYDVGGGNGFVALELQKRGVDVALVEPGIGAVNAADRGVENVIQATLDGAGLRPGSLPSAAAFDVIEHVEDDVAFLSTIRRMLTPRGRFYCTVPAGQRLWSDEDIYAGHFRRYSTDTLSKALIEAGFRVEFITAIFGWLVPVVALLRVLPFRLRGNKASELGDAGHVKSDHTLPAFMKSAVQCFNARELVRINETQTASWGTSLLCVAGLQE
jgi:SAM-dependent methyltransferase